MARLRYIGQVKQNFKDVAVMPTWANPDAPPLVARVGELEPGQEFTVPDELAERYTRRADVEVVDAPAEPGAAAPEAPAPVEGAPAAETPAAPAATASRTKAPRSKPAPGATSS